MAENGIKAITELEICVIGAGNLGAALVRGFSKDGGPKLVRVCDKTQSKIEALSSYDRVSGSTDLAKMVRGADVVLVAVKPKSVPELLNHLAGMLEQSPLILSVAAGVGTAVYTSALPEGSRVARAMPNVASRIEMGLTGVYATSEADSVVAEQLFSLVGLVSRVSDQDQLDAITGASASAQAFVCLLIKALAEGGEKMGLSSDESLRIAAQTVLGAGALVLQDGRHPAEIIDSIATPGGTTVAGLAVLEQHGFCEAVVSAVEASTNVARKTRS